MKGNGSACHIACVFNRGNICHYIPNSKLLSSLDCDRDEKEPFIAIATDDIQNGHIAVVEFGEKTTVRLAKMEDLI